MNTTQKIDWNKAQAEKNGWTPEWFDCSDFDADLIDAITQFQRDNGLSADGLCGSGTFRVIWTARETEMEMEQIDFENHRQKYIIYNNEATEIYWERVVLWNQEGGKEASVGNYSSYAGEPPRKPRFFVTHWDVALSASSCFRILEKRGISVHFSIDNDGCIYQWLDCQHTAWQAGSRTWNHHSVGVEVSDAYSLKYQDWYKDKGFGERPIWKDAKVHGKTLDPFLGFYDIQIDALAALWEAVSFACDIPLELPQTQNGVDQECASGYFKGFCNHYHLTTRKIDCAGLDNNLVLSKALRIRQKRLSQ